MSWWVRPNIREGHRAPWHLLISGRTACNRAVGERWDVFPRRALPLPRTRCRSCTRATFKEAA